MNVVITLEDILLSGEFAIASLTAPTPSSFGIQVYNDLTSSLKSLHRDIDFFCCVKVKKVCKTVHNTVLIYIRTPQLTGHSCMCVYAKTEN